MSKAVSALRKTFFSELILTKSMGHRIAYIAVITALSVVSNMFLEFRLFDVQFSVTIVVSALAGILLGPLFGFVACYIGDLLGYVAEPTKYYAVEGTNVFFEFLKDGVPVDALDFLE